MGSQFRAPVSPVTAPTASSSYLLRIMPGPRDLSPAESRTIRTRRHSAPPAIRLGAPTGTSAPLPVGFVRRRIVERERQKVEEYLTGLRDLLEQYTLPTAGKVQDFMNRATATGPDASGLFEMTGQNVVYPGDTFSIWVNPRTHHPQKIQVSTTFQGDPVNLTATFKTLPGGLNHVAYAEVTAPARQLSVQVQNFAYNRNN